MKQVQESEVSNLNKHLRRIQQFYNNLNKWIKKKMYCYALYRGSPSPIYKCQRLHDLLVTTIYRLLLLHDMWWMLKHDIWWMLLLHDMWWMHKHDMWWMTVTFLSLKGTAWPFGHYHIPYTAYFYCTTCDECFSTTCDGCCYCTTCDGCISTTCDGWL